MKVTTACLDFWWMTYLSLISCVISQQSELVEIKIGGIFYKGATEQIEIFNLANNLTLKNETARLVTIVREVEHGDILAAKDHVCDLAMEGVYSIVDATDGRTSAHIEAVCDTLEMPQVITRPNLLQSKNWSVVNLYPSATTYNRILVELIQKKDWQNFTIMYVKGHTIDRMNSLLELNNLLDLYTVTVRELSGNNYRPEFAAAKQKGSVNFLVDCPANKLTQVLSQAQEVGLMSNKHSYIFTSTDLHNVNLDQFKYGGANITGFSLVDSNDVLVKSISAKIEGTLLTDMALVYDAAMVTAGAYEKLPVIPTPVTCGTGQTWQDGSSVINIMRTNIVKGLTREILFNSEGQRTNFTFDIYELTRADIKNVAIWKDELKIVREYIQLTTEDGGIMRNKTFTVLIALTPPFAYVKETVNEMSGNDRYEGFAVDIIDKMSQSLGFSYILKEEKTGGEFKNNKATGMIQKIMDNEADFAISDLTITHERLLAIDFTTPFMSVGVSILYKKPSKQPPAMFSFMEPFSKEVWTYMMLSQLALGVVIVFVGRISHKEWHNPFPCVEQPESLDNQFSLANAIWLIIGSVMQQGSEIAPIALAPRAVTSVWWFFTMVMISSYTGTLVAFLTVESKTVPFKTAKDLANQNYISYGAKKGGSTLQFFNQSDPVYKQMFKNMIKDDYEWCTADPDGNTKGRERVQAGRYAFFMESAAIEYELERNCDLMQVGDLLDTKNYGIGIIKNSRYREAMSNEILKMKETGTLQKLKDKWWRERRGGGACTDADKGGEPTQLEMKNVIGAFVVLGVGCLIGIFISILDMLWGVYKRTIKYNTTYRYELVEELRFALRFSGDTKPVRKRPQAVSDNTAEEEKFEAKDELDSLRSNLSFGSADTRNTRHSHCTHGSSRSQSLAFARRRRYS